MPKSNLFSLLMRSPWWASFLVAGVLFALTRLVLPDAAALFSGLPFLVIGIYAGWRQLRAPGARAVEATLEGLRAQSWSEVASRLEEAWRAQGFEVSALPGPAADFELRKGGRVTLVSVKRWKTAQTGIGPLRELVEARKSREASDCICIQTGELSANARAFAADHGVRVLDGTELAVLLR